MATGGLIGTITGLTFSLVDSKETGGFLDLRTGESVSVGGAAIRGVDSKCLINKILSEFDIVVIFRVSSIYFPTRTPLRLYLISSSLVKAFTLIIFSFNQSSFPLILILGIVFLFLSLSY